MTVEGWARRSCTLAMPIIDCRVLLVVALTTLLCFKCASQQMAPNVSYSETNDTSPSNMTLVPLRLNSTSSLQSNGTVSNISNPDSRTFRYLPHSPIRQNETFHFFFNPLSINDLVVASNRTVDFNCTSNNILQYVNNGTGSQSGNFSQTKDRLDFSNISLIVVIRAHDREIAGLLLTKDTHDGEMHKSEKMAEEQPVTSSLIYKSIQLNSANNFTVLAMHMGYATMSVTLTDTNDLEMVKQGAYHTLAHAEYDIQTTRAVRPSDFAFNCSAAAIAILISFGIGCVTDTESLKKQLKFPVSLVVGFCCQFLILPVLAFGIAMMLPLNNDVRFGLLCVACVPGGGLGHVAVILGDADLPLSLAMNLISIVAMLGTAPLWIFVLGQYFYRDHKVIPIYNFEIWLASTFFAYTAGLVINRFKPAVADALLTWIIKPLMLLASILYITLGVYINMYVFDRINEYAVLSAFLLPLSGFTVAYITGKIFRQKDTFCKSMALETSSLNVLIVLAAIRFSLASNKNSADFASVVPLWVMFTIPGIYVLLAILRFFKGCIGNFLESRKQQQFRHFSIASGIVNQANMAALSAPLFVTEVTDDDQGSVSEKITVL